MTKNVAPGLVGGVDPVWVLILPDKWFSVKVLRCRLRFGWSAGLALLVHILSACSGTTKTLKEIS